MVPAADAEDLPDAHNIGDDPLGSSDELSNEDEEPYGPYFEFDTFRMIKNVNNDLGMKIWRFATQNRLFQTCLARLLKFLKTEINSEEDIEELKQLPSKPKMLENRLGLFNLEMKIGQT